MTRPYILGGHFQRSRQILAVLVHGSQLFYQDGFPVRLVFWELVVGHQIWVVVHGASANSIALTFLRALERCKTAIPLDLLESVQMLPSLFSHWMIELKAGLFLVKGDASDLGS